MAPSTPEEASDKPIINLPAERGTNSFALFGMLPIELRIIIWHYAMEEPRIVDFALPQLRDWDNYYPARHLCSPILRVEGYLHQQLPLFFCVSRESRQLALELYAKHMLINHKLVGRFITPEEDILINEFDLFGSENFDAPYFQDPSYYVGHYSNAYRPLLDLRRLKPDLAKTKARLSERTHRHGRQGRLTRRVVRLENRIKQLEPQIESRVMCFARNCLDWRWEQGINIVERWKLFLGDDPDKHWMIRALMNNFVAYQTLEQLERRIHTDLQVQQLYILMGREESGLSIIRSTRNSI